MFRYLVAFFLLRLLPAWMQDRSPDESHFYRRLFTQRHRAKRRWVRYVWLSSASVVLLFPSLPLMIALGLLSTFISFSLLDESAG